MPTCKSSVLKLTTWNIQVLLLMMIFIYPGTSILPQVQSQSITKISQVRELLRERIYPGNSFVHSHILDDLYIHRWLKCSDFNVNRTVTSLLNHLAWRKAEKIDTIHLEDWSYFQDEYPQYFNTTDKFGRPIAEYWMTVWDVRRAVLSGISRQLLRWVTLQDEMIERRLFEIRSRAGNKNITGAMEIVDIAGFGSRQLACTVCWSFHLSVNKMAEERYPYLFADVTVLNVGGVFRQFLGSLNKDFGSRNSPVPRLYSTRREWLPVLDREIDKNQRSVRFGGTIDRGYQI